MKDLWRQFIKNFLTVHKVDMLRSSAPHSRKSIANNSKINRSLQHFRETAGSPCSRCASMKLTEAKFTISEYSKHQRAPRTAAENTSDYPLGDLGPDGLGLGPHEFKLGTLAELYGKSETCPFCGLAVSSLIGQCKWFRDTYQKSEGDFYQIDASCFVSMYDLLSVGPFYGSQVSRHIPRHAIVSISTLYGSI